ncbi:MAG: MFS transporter [Streptosporangiaceae bacterium]
MITRYHELFIVPGAAGFSLAALVGRFPIAMLGLGIVFLVADLTGSYATAGAVSAITVIGYAAAAPLSGRLIDQYGQHRMLLTLAGLHFVGLTSMMLVGELGSPVWALCLTGLVTGASRPSTGTMVRTPCVPSRPPHDGGLLSLAGRAGQGR